VDLLALFHAGLFLGDSWFSYEACLMTVVLFSSSPFFHYQNVCRYVGADAFTLLGMYAMVGSLAGMCACASMRLQTTCGVVLGAFALSPYWAGLET
jgi:hypothetical protein